MVPSDRLRSSVKHHLFVVREEDPFEHWQLHDRESRPREHTRSHARLVTFFVNLHAMKLGMIREEDENEEGQREGSFLEARER